LREEDVDINELAQLIGDDNRTNHLVEERLEEDKTEVNEEAIE
jgi:hypothetical protein